MRLTDNQILHIFCEALLREASKPPAEQNHFLSAYADAVRMANHRDFLIMRATSLILIGEYNLGYLVEGSDPEILVHNFPRRTA